ncbi:MAG: hypothetical protein HOK67_19435 [Deltaproteobacteria bacterium]|jgi:Na+-translocating ferredoxin:NAD+ oxidoreductase subunit B|nr:hypothetical protein [Deltaproteobacteria bacterium]MBT4641637.1 hypothetical protein [Deltaproteobacteria bacterium]MBT6502061.1 hypothetical protein [Deltaproteobacteria bacterium]MBT7151523.1 hypothetical protein [Deltaproteobacteria bacterium]MBT7713634.1 hypothetical protein [Deltaproteobacteria bacterium]
MSDNIYRHLQEKLDNYAIGFPATESGIEIELRQKLFSETDAELFQELTLALEHPQTIARRTGRDVSAAAQLEEMANNGLLFRLRKGEKSRSQKNRRRKKQNCNPTLHLQGTTTSAGQ